LSDAVGPQPVPHKKNDLSLLHVFVEYDSAPAAEQYEAEHH
jgi:hypothetical protein